MGNVFTFYAAVNLDPADPLFHGAMIADSYYANFKKTPDYTHSNWLFDSNAVFSVCADLDGTSSVECEVQNFKVLTNMPTYLNEVLLGNKGCS